MEETLIYRRDADIPKRRWFMEESLIYRRVADLWKSCWSTEESLMYGSDADLQKRRWCTKEKLIYGRDIDIRKRHCYTGEMLIYRRDADMRKRRWYIWPKATKVLKEETHYIWYDSLWVIFHEIIVMKCSWKKYHFLLFVTDINIFSSWLISRGERDVELSF